MSPLICGIFPRPVLDQLGRNQAQPSLLTRWIPRPAGRSDAGFD
jgi:hypothetical protein